MSFKLLCPIVLQVRAGLEVGHFMGHAMRGLSVLQLGSFPCPCSDLLACVCVCVAQLMFARNASTLKKLESTNSPSVGWGPQHRAVRTVSYGRVRVGGSRWSALSHLSRIASALNRVLVGVCLQSRSDYSVGVFSRATITLDTVATPKSPNPRCPGLADRLCFLHLTLRRTFVFCFVCVNPSCVTC